MDKYDISGPCTKSVGTLERPLERTDIKTELKSNIKWVENDIARSTERLRVYKEKLKLIEKNKDLEAYLNLSRENY